MTNASHDLDQYDRPSITVDVVIFSLAMAQSDLRVLLVQRSREPFLGMWSLPGGFVQIEESLEGAAARQLAAKTGLESVYIEQLFTFGSPERDPRRHVITVAYSALVPYSIIEEPAPDAPLQWFSVYDRPKLAFDHADIVDYALQRLRYKLEYTAVGFELLPNEFTLSSLQQAYEIVLAEKLDKRNFRRKILSADIIQETGKKSRSGEGRPAKLYRYQDNAVAEIKARRLFP
jgi:8-oxo-dGTP diphosphatase